MEVLPIQRRISGLSGEKWTLHQLKAIQPTLEHLDHQYRTFAASNGADGLQIETVETVIQQLIDLLKVGSSPKAVLIASIKCMGADLLTDVIRAITAYQCFHAKSTAESSTSEFLVLSVIELCEALFASFEETHTLASVQDDEPQLEGRILASRSLNTIAGLGNNGFEDTATLLLECVLHALTSGSNSAQHRKRLQYLLSYARAYLKFSQSITRFHNNRKKLFTNLCEKLLTCAVPLLSRCNALMCESQNTSSVDAQFTTKHVAPLQKVLCELLEGGLFDDKNIEEFATLRLESTAEEVRLAEEAANNNRNNKSNKKAKKNEPEETVSSSTTVAVSSNVSVAETVSGKNKAYHDTLFRTLSMDYYDASTATAPIGCDSFASGVAWIVRIYGDKSAALALIASNQGSTGRGGNFNFGNKTAGAVASLGSDVVNTRKHLIRVFHFSFLMLEAFRLNENEFSVAETLQALPACAVAEPAVSVGGASGKKKRRHSEANLSNSAGGQVSEAAAEWLSQVRRIVKEHQVRNEILAACVHLLRLQSIPNHESLQRYVERLVCLSAACVQECLTLQRLLTDVAPSATVAGATDCVQELLALNIDCVRLVASIDHITIVDHRLRDIIQVLSCVYHGAFDPATAAPGELRLYLSKGELLKAVLNVHGELRLMDQLANELFYRENLQVVSSATMLHSTLLSRDISGLLIKLLIAAPTGQIPQLWGHLAGATTESSKASDCSAQHVGVVTCAFARALMHAQLHSVRSNITILQLDAGAGPSSDGLDEGTVCMTRLLHKLALTLQSATASAQKSSNSPRNAELLRHVLLTLSALQRFVAHMYAGSMTQLVLACPSSSNQSFFEITMTTVLNNLVALKKTSTNYGSILKALLSLLLLHSNVTAKVAPSSIEQFGASTQILHKYTRDLLTVDAAVAEKLGGGEALLVEVLEIVLCDIRVWSQYISPESDGAVSGATFVSAKHFAALFQGYLRAARAVQSSESRGALSRIRLLMSNAAVADNNFIREALHNALADEWVALPGLSASNPAACQARCEFVSVLNATLPGDIIFNATAFVSTLYPVLVQSCNVLAKSHPDANAESRLLGGVSAIATVLAGNLRLCRGQIVRTPFSVDASENPLSPFLAVVMKLVSEKSSTPGILLAQLLKLVDDALQVTSTNSMQQSEELIPLLCIMLDAFVSHFVREVSIPREEGDRSRAFAEASLAKVSEFLKTAVLRMCSNHCASVAFDATKQVFHTVISCYAAAMTWKRAGDGSAPLSLLPVASSLDLIQELLVENLLPKNSNSKANSPAAEVSGNTLHFVAEVTVILAQLKSTAGAKDVSGQFPSNVVQALLTYAAGVVNHAMKGDKGSAENTRGAEGWLHLLGATAGPVLTHCGVVNVTPVADDDVESSATVLIDLCKLDSLYRLIGQIISAVDQTESSANPLSVTMISLLACVVKTIFGARVCNCEPSQVVAVLKHALLKAMLDAQEDRRLLVASLCRDLLIYFTEYGRKLLVTSRVGQEKFQAFHDSLIVVAVEIFQEIAAAQVSRTAQSIDDAASLLQCTNTVTLTFAAVIQRQGRAGARRKNKENDTRSATFRCDLWFDGLLGIVSLSLSHLHMWRTSSVSAAVSIPSGVHPAADAALCNNASSVLLAKSILQVAERFIAVSSSSSLPNLNTAIGAVVQMITTVLSLLLDIEVAVAAPAAHSKLSATAVINVASEAVADALKLNLSSCYHLLCRIFGNVASSQVLEKHIHFIACAVVETLSKASVTRNFQDLAYPGIYSLFEKCQSRQKTQMFAMLDTQSRTLMTDLHNEFVRSFKFVGK